jgi:hypothetical protein
LSTPEIVDRFATRALDRERSTALGQFFTTDAILVDAAAVMRLAALAGRDEPASTDAEQPAAVTTADLGLGPAARPERALAFLLAELPPLPLRAQLGNVSRKTRGCYLGVMDISKCPVSHAQ